MRPLPLLSVALLLLAFASYSQSPPGINYQGVARNFDGKPLVLKDIAIKINIVKDGDNGEVEYSEIHAIKTNSFGLFTLVIGTGSPVTGIFQFVSWAAGKKWLRIEMDPDGGNAFKVMGSQQFMSVPYAFYAQYSGSTLKAGTGLSITNNTINNTGDNDNDPGNELNGAFELTPERKLRLTDAGGTREVDLTGLSTNQTLSGVLTIGNDAGNLTIQNLGTPVNPTDAATKSYVESKTAGLDNSPTNEFQDIQLQDDKLTLTNSASEVDLSDYLDNTDKQDLSLSGTNLSISGGTGVNLSGLQQDLTSTSLGTTRTIMITNGTPATIDIADNDNSTINEIQDITRSGNTLALSGDSTPVDLTVFMDDTDQQRLTLTGTSLAIDRGNSINLLPFMDDTDDQDLALNPATHSLSLSGDPTPVDLEPYMDNTDNQNLSIMTPGNSRTINIQNGTGVTFSVADGDADPTNELQSIAYNAATKNLSISPGNSVIITETQNLNQVLLQGNDANGQKITNLGAPTVSTDAVTKQYVDNVDAALNARISANYAFKANFTYSNLLAIGNNIAIPLTDNFDDFNIVGATNFTAAVAGTYMFFVDGSISVILGGPAISILYNGTKYPVAIASNNRYNSTFMFKLTAGQTVSLVGDGLGVGASINGSFFGQKLP